MATIRCWSGSGVTQFAQSTAYSSGNRIVPLLSDAGTNYLVARRYVWECTTAGTTAAANPTWPASVTPDTTTINSNGTIFTARNPGYSSGSTVNWTFATPLFEYAAMAVVADGDVVLVQKTHSQTFTQATVSLTLAGKCQIICVDKDAAEISTTGALVSGGAVGSFSFSLTPATSKAAYVGGVEFRGSTSSYSSGGMFFGNGYQHSMVLDNCVVDQKNPSVVGGFIMFGGSNDQSSRNILVNNCTLKYATTDTGLLNGCAKLKFVNCRMSEGTAHPNQYLTPFNRGGDTAFEGCDFSKVNGNLVGNSAGPSSVTFASCVVGAAAQLIATQTAPGLEATAYGCVWGGKPFQFRHANFYGSTEATVDKHANDGASYDGLQRYSWKITTTANASFYTPYVSPWFGTFHNDTQPISPSVEILREGSTVPLTNAEVWPEFSVQVTYASTLATITSARMAPLGTAAAWATGIGESNWTGWFGSAWSGKLSYPGQVTPQAIGDLKARICVGAPSTTLYSDPQVRT